MRVQVRTKDMCNVQQDAVNQYKNGYRWMLLLSRQRRENMIIQFT